MKKQDNNTESLGEEWTYKSNRDMKKEFKANVQEYVEKQLEGRDKQNNLKDEVDFFAGAMSVLVVVNEMFFDSKPDDTMNLAPIMWILGPMSGRKYVGKKRNKPNTYGDWS
tara:strand:+ start:903 stop:1235 length:333 start_codon:yes stop_codon:yes gene_type:complete